MSHWQVPVFDLLPEIRGIIFDHIVSTLGLELSLRLRLVSSMYFEVLGVSLYLTCAV